MVRHWRSVQGFGPLGSIYIPTSLTKTLACLKDVIMTHSLTKEVQNFNALNHDL